MVPTPPSRDIGEVGERAASAKPALEREAGGPAHTLARFHAIPIDRQHGRASRGGFPRSIPEVDIRKLLDILEAYSMTKY
jgi:hypothetical protein